MVKGHQSCCGLQSNIQQCVLVSSYFVLFVSSVVLLLFQCIIDERWRDSRTSEHFSTCLLVTMHYTCQQMPCLVAIVTAPMQGQLLPPSWTW